MTAKNQIYSFSASKDDIEAIEFCKLLYGISNRSELFRTIIQESIERKMKERLVDEANMQ